MTVHVQHRVAQQDDKPESGATARPRPRWLLPGVAVAMVAAVLVIAGVVPLSTVVYVALFGGMILMHAGHGGHSAHVSHDEHLSRPSSHTHAANASWADGGVRQPDDPSTGEMTDHE